jgi:hypothetical protein
MEIAFAINDEDLKNLRIIRKIKLLFLTNNIANLSSKKLKDN